MTTISVGKKHLQVLNEVRGNGKDMATAMSEIIKGYEAYKAGIPVGNSEIQEFDLDKIKTNPYQMREVEFEDVVELAYDIYNNTMLQIPIGRILPDGTVEQAFGRRRKKAHELIVAHGQSGDEDFENWEQFTKMRLIIKPLTDLEMYSYMASENGQRTNPNAIEIARSIKMGQEMFGLTLEEAGKPHGIFSKGQVSDVVSLLLLPESVQDLIAKGRFGSNGKGEGKGHGRELVRMVRAGMDEDTVNTVAFAAVEQDLSVSLLKKRIDNEINLYKLKTEKVIRHCSNPTCGNAVEMSAFEVSMQGNEFRKCEKCSDSSRISQWLTPEKYEEMQKLQAQANAYQQTNIFDVVAICPVCEGMTLNKQTLICSKCGEIDQAAAKKAVAQSEQPEQSEPVEDVPLLVDALVVRWCPDCGNCQEIFQHAPIDPSCDNCGETNPFTDWLEQPAPDELHLVEEFPAAEPSQDEPVAEEHQELESAIPTWETTTQFIRIPQDPNFKEKVDELVTRLEACLCEDEQINEAAILLVLQEIEKKEKREAKIREALSNVLTRQVLDNVVRLLLKTL